VIDCFSKHAAADVDPFDAVVPPPGHGVSALDPVEAT
jgi:hypothetical protein